MENPVSPVDRSTNFSYPSRGNLREDNEQAPSMSPSRSSRFENLKAAAIGLHVSQSL